MPVLHNIGTLAQCRMEGGQGALHLIQNAALCWQAETITWVGAERDLPATLKNGERIDAGGKLVIPGLIDCHTHLVFGGWRADEFEQRIQGRTYLEIAEAGGGIASTMRHTRAASVEDLKVKGLALLSEMAALGVTTVECKSGYGLTFEAERKQLEVYRELGKLQPLELIPTFLGAHIVPPEYATRREDYIALLTQQMIPAFAKEKLAEFCDAFMERSAFSREETKTILEAGKRHGLSPKLHADQLTAGGGAELAGALGAASADHLEHISDAGILALLENDVVAVMLPIASLYTFHTPLNARRLIETGVKVAVATDFNPGSAPSYHLPLALLLACTLNRMSPAEALKGATIYAAKALRRENKLGSLEVGKQADFVLLNAPSVNHWLYHFQPNACCRVVKKGITI